MKYWIMDLHPDRMKPFLHTLIHRGIDCCQDNPVCGLPFPYNLYNHGMLDASALT